MKSRLFQDGCLLLTPILLSIKHCLSSLLVLATQYRSLLASPCIALNNRHSCTAAYSSSIKAILEETRIFIESISLYVHTLLSNAHGVKISRRKMYTLMIFTMVLSVIVLESMIFETWADMRSPFREASANQDAPQGPNPAPISDPQPIKTLLNASCFIYCCSLTYLYHLCAYIVDSP